MSALETALTHDMPIISSSSITDIYYIIRNSLRSDIAKEKLKDLISVIKVTDTKETDIEKALNSNISDFKDAVVSMIAERTKCKYILTRNIVDFKNSEVPAILPSDFIQRIFNLSKKNMNPVSPFISYCFQSLQIWNKQLFFSVLILSYL